jgi:hypothetical protein
MTPLTSEIIGATEISAAVGTILNAAEQEEVVPPLTPWQVQVHGPEPATGDVVPVKQRPSVGRTVKAPLLELPQEPLILLTTKVAVV